jgi:class 3 adenylate cyclase/tetratricopeptide (TPR) repeat protein
VDACARCGEANPPGARFCHACGALLGTAAGRETRKVVTVLFADVTGSTALGERIDPESLRRVLGRYFEVARERVERHGGTVEKFIGDAVMAVFGVPAVHEDDALRAVRAAAELQEAVVALNADLERDYGVALQLRIGVNTGEVVTGTDERLATGDAVNVAARLEQAARPGEILLGDRTRRLVGAAVEAELVAPLELRGKSELVAAHLLVRVVQGAEALDRRFDAPLVGRADELGTLRAAFDAAVSERRCRLVTVLGPPGIGKSRLVRELESGLAGQASVLTGRCLAYGDGITYWPLVEIFRDAGADEELADALSAGAAEEIAWSVRKVLERRARHRPLALIVEDIHWAEPTLLDLLEQVAQWTRDAPLLLLCSSRPELRDGRPAWGGEVVTLDPLSDEQADELIAERLGESALEDGTRARILQVAGGNPLFVEQLLAMVAEGGEPERVPPSIQALLAARLDALPEEERDLVERASVVGLQFEWEALAALAPGGRRPAGSVLTALVRKELIRPHELIEDLFEFRHLLIRDSAYERIPKDRRADLHERFAGWVDGRGAELDEIVGYHLEQAYRYTVELGPETDRARAVARRAAAPLAASGVRANARGDIEAAANLLERAATLLPADATERLRLLPTLGRTMRERGHLEQAEAVLAEAVVRGQAAGEPMVAADASVALSDVRLHATRVLRADVVRTIERAVVQARDHGDEAVLARALTLAGKLRFWAGEAAAAIADLEQAAIHARNAGDRAQVAESVYYQCVGHVVGPTPVHDALAGLAGIAASTRPNARVELVVLESRARLEAMRGHMDEARVALGQAGAVAADHGFAVVLSGRLGVSTGIVDLVAGDPVAAEAAVRPACERLAAVGELGHLASAVPVLLEAMYAQGRDDDALALSDRWPPNRLTVPEDVDAQCAWRRVRAKIVARMGDVEEGERIAREGIAIASATDYLEVRGDGWAALGEILRGADRLDEAAAAVGQAARLCERKGMASVRSLPGNASSPPVEV